MRLLDRLIHSLTTFAMEDLMPEETVYLTERELEVMRIFVSHRILKNSDIIIELQTLISKLEK